MLNGFKKVVKVGQNLGVIAHNGNLVKEWFRLQSFMVLTVISGNSEDIDVILAHLVSVSPTLTGRNITLTGSNSTEALDNAETLRSNSNTVNLTL